MVSSDALSPLSLAILGLVFLQPQSGYDLRKVFSTTPMGHFSSSPGAIYPALERLEKGGLIQGVNDLERALRPKRKYELTMAGKRTLVENLSRPITHEDVIWRMDELLLRFAFMGDVLDRRRTLPFLRDFLAAVEGYSRSLKAQLDAFPSCPSPNPRLALEFGRMSYLSAARWARQAIRRIETA